MITHDQVMFGVFGRFDLAALMQTHLTVLCVGLCNGREREGGGGGRLGEGAANMSMQLCGS